MSTTININLWYGDVHYEAIHKIQSQAQSPDFKAMRRWTTRYDNIN